MRKFVVIAGNNPGVVKRAMLKRGNWEDVTEDKADGNFDNVHFIWKPTNLPIRSYARMDSNPSNYDIITIINHFENNNGICTKTGLIRSLRTYYFSTEQAIMNRYSLFETTPTTFLITAGDENQEYVNFMARFRDISKKMFNKEHVPEKHCEENLWLIKPANMNQGRGIEIFKNLKDIQSFLNSQMPNTYWVAQKYIEKPLLYYGRKFDIRVWVIVTAKMEIFFYKTPYIRTSSNKYVTDAFDNYIHLTNNCLQKFGENFGKFENGNTLPLSTLQEYINEQFPQLGLDVQKQIVPRMKDLIIDTILSVKKALNPKRRKNVFELFGYDFLIDEDFRTWLLEVNTNPYLGVPNEFIKTLLPEMMDDLLRIVLDPIHPPTSPEMQTDKPNDFELIYCEYHSTYHEGPMNVRSAYHENIYPIPSIAPPLKHVKAATLIEREPREHRDLTKEISPVNNLLRVRNDKDHAEPVPKEKKTFDQDTSIVRRSLKPISKMGSIDLNEPEGVNSPQLEKEKRPSFGGVTDTRDKGFNNNGIAETAKKIDFLLESYLVMDYENFLPLISRLLSCLNNWELSSKKEISSACKSILTLSESKMSGVLTEPNFVTQMINLLDSQNVPLKIQITLVTGFLNICNKISEMKKIVCDKMIHALIKMALASCNTNEMQNYDLQVMRTAVKCLCALSGKSKRNYIPGETRDQSKVRDFLISQGGILALLVVSKLSFDEEIQKMPSDCFFFLDSSDWELQKNILEKYKEGKLTISMKEPMEEMEAAGSNGANSSVKTKPNMCFLFPLTTSMAPKADNKGVGEVSPNIPKELLEIKDYSVDSMIEDVEEKISFLREEKKKREKGEEEKREQALLEQIKEQQQKDLVILERKKKAEEIFLKRLDEKKRQQEEVAKKMEEEMKIRHQMEEERRKAKLQELVKKREEYERKTKKFDQKKKKLEDDMRKMIDEEVEKKKAQRKALEESFWTRVRAKEKEKNLEKLNLNLEEARFKEHLHLRIIERAPSVEPPNRSRDDSSDKSTVLRTHTQTYNTPQHSRHDSRTNTFTTYFKNELTIRSALLSPSSNNNRGPRQRSVEEGHSRRKKDDAVALPPLIDNKMKGKYSIEKTTKMSKDTMLFTLNEAVHEEEGNTLCLDQSPSSPLIRHVPKHLNSGRQEDQEKIRKSVIVESKTRSLISLKESAPDRERIKEKEKVERVERVVRQGTIIRQTSPNSMNDLIQSSPYKMYSSKRKAKPATVKN